jgi:ubiquitin-conjugating enzyme E2 S
MEELNSQVIKQILRELKEIDKENLDDIKIEITRDRIDEIFAWLQGPQGTPYEGGWFKIRLVFGNEFPDIPPKGNFVCLKRLLTIDL